MTKLTDYLINEHDADSANIRFQGDGITILGDTLTLGMDEAKEENGYVGSGIKERFLKIFII